MNAITPCLWFDGNGLEAAEHYVSVIPDSRITDVSYYSPEQPGAQRAVMTLAFELAGRPFTALNGGPGDKDPLRANAAVQAMLGMTKIDIQALRDAADAAAS
jgi:predicted 3-demethylubiquinone-9 3-methyltransferase (glyoxalase superfamily)